MTNADYGIPVPVMLNDEDRQVLDSIMSPSRVAALEAECAALTDALTETTHDHRKPPMDIAWAARHANGITDPCWFCGGTPSTAVHRTPARVRAELGQDPAGGQ